MSEKYTLKSMPATGNQIEGFKDNATVTLRFKGKPSTAIKLLKAINEALAHICDSG